MLSVTFTSHSKAPLAYGVPGCMEWLHLVLPHSSYSPPFQGTDGATEEKVVLFVEPNDLGSAQVGKRTDRGVMKHSQLGDM